MTDQLRRPDRPEHYIACSDVSARIAATRYAEDRAQECAALIASERLKLILLHHSRQAGTFKAIKGGSYMDLTYGCRKAISAWSREIERLRGKA